MIAMKDPKDQEKREKAERLIKKQTGKKYKRKENDVLPLEWLIPKDRHINSIDSLMHHEDLVKDSSTAHGGHKKQRQQQRRDVIEGYLFEKQIMKWDGTVKEIRTDWKGTIVFKRHFDVLFVPQNVQPSMPSTGDTVRFCLSFDRLGLMAWAVQACPSNSPKSFSQTVSSEEESDTSEDENDQESEDILDTSIFNEIAHVESGPKCWEDYDGKRMQGLVVSTNIKKGCGILEHPHAEGPLFFHAAQLVVPVKSLEGEIMKFMVLEFKVEQLTERLRAADVHIVKEEDMTPAMKKFRDKKRSSPGTSRQKKDHKTVGEKTVDQRKRIEEGVIVKLHTGQDYGFIKADDQSYGRDVFFHFRSLVNKQQRPQTNDRVQFYTSKGERGFEANEIRVQNQFASIQKWEQLTDVLVGSVSSVSDDGGYITSTWKPQLGYLSFRNTDVLKGIAQVKEGAEVQFKTKKRGGKCVAVEIDVISSFS